MVLVDTSVLIDFLRNRTNTKSQLFEEILDRGLPWGINDFIYQEILQGSKTENEFTTLKAYLGSLPFYFLKLGTKSFEQAAQLNVRCRSNGVTVRSTIDLLIAETAIENDVSLLYNDGDFDNMRRVVTELRSYE